MKKQLDKLIKKVKINKRLFVFLIALVIVGVASGAIFASILSESDKVLVSKYLNNFIDDLRNSKFVNNTSLFNISIFSSGFAFLIWLFGISVIGIVFILPFIFIKSFILGFTIGCIVINFKLKGILISFIYIIPHQIINILIYILVSSYAIIVSMKLIKSLKNKKVFDFKKIMNKYTFILFFSEIVLFASALYETYALPHVIKLAVKLIK